MRIVNSDPNTVAWKADSAGLRHNDEITVGQDIEIVLFCEGRSYAAREGRYTVGGILNPQKEKRLSNPEVRCDIYAVKSGGRFSNAWGIGLDYKEAELTKMNIDKPQRAQSNGQYTFEVSDLENFIKTMNMSSREEFTDEGVKLAMRDKIHESIRSFLSAELKTKSIFALQGELRLISGRIKEALNPRLGIFGIKITDFTFNMLSNPDAGLLERIGEAQVQRKEDQIRNETRKEDAQIKRMGEGGNAKAASQGAPQAAAKGIVCKRCNTVSGGGVNYCPVCGDKLK